MLNTAKKIDEGLQQLSNDQFYKPLPSPIVQDTARKVNELINIKTTYCDNTRVLFEESNFIANTQILDNVVLELLDVSSLYTNIPQEKGIGVVCRYYEDHYEQKLPFPTSDLRPGCYGN